MATKLATSKVNAAAHLISDLLAESVDGATLKQICNDLLIGPVLAKAALESTEAVEINGRWCIASSDDAPAKPAPAPAPAKATSQPVCTVCQTKTDIAPLSLTGECQGCYEDAMDKAWWDSVGETLKDLAMDEERQQVLNIIKTGATLARIAELTGLHADDVLHHVDVLIDMGKVVARPVVVATAYEVVA